jgi:hypothetical protein
MSAVNGPPQDLRFFDAIGETCFEAWMDLFAPGWRHSKDGLKDARYKDLRSAFSAGWLAVQDPDAFIAEAARERTRRIEEFKHGRS